MLQKGCADALSGPRAPLSVSLSHRERVCVVLRRLQGAMELQGTGEVPSDELRADISGTGQFSDEVRTRVRSAVCACAVCVSVQCV